VSKLKDEKQFRVICVMSESTVDGKKKFLLKLRNKFAAQQAEEQQSQVQKEQELEELIERTQALSAARVKQYRSSNAVLGSKENVASGGNMGSTTAVLATRDVVPVARSFSSSSVNITKEDIRSVGKLLGNAHIGESEQNLRELEISKFTTQQQNAADAGMDQFSKRERPESSRNLAKSEEKALQRTRSQQQDPSNDSPSRGSLSDSQDGDDGGDGSNDPEDPDAPTTKRWTKSQDSSLRESVRIHGEKNWKAIAELVPGRNHAQCLQRWRKVLKPGLVKGHWSFEEDQVLEFLVTQGCNNWGQIAERIPGRTPKQCRERWKNHLDPAINKGPYTEEEDTIILSAQERLGNKWSQIAQLLKGRTEDSVKIRWKSLKQNPSKAAAAHAQQKKNQQQHHGQRHGQGMGGMGDIPGSNGYPPNAALMRQRQLQLLHQQQQLQQNEAAQQLEHQQQIQQQQFQLRLQEKMMHQQQQLHRQSLQPPEDMLDGVKGESYQQQHSNGSRMLPQMAMPTMSADQLHAYQWCWSEDQEYCAPYIACENRNLIVYPANDYCLNPPVGPSDDEVRDSNDSWDFNQDLADILGLNTRLGENPPPSTFWENYPKQHMGDEPIPIALQPMLQDPNRTPTSGSHHQHYAGGHDDFNDAIFEKLATELGSQDMHFGPV
jgi:myb proto-oncogene protein